MTHIVLTKTDTATSGDMTERGRNALCALARRLIESGAEDDLAYIWRGETLCFIPIPLSAWANTTVREGDAQSARFAKYVPMPDGLHGAAE